jgi:hypothetical protein
MRSLFPSSYDRADVLMSAGCSTFVSAALILVIPRVGVVLLEILLGAFFIGCALIARARLRAQERSKGMEGPEGLAYTKTKWFDRYDVLMILVVIVIYSTMSGLLRHRGLSEGTVGILPLILFAVGILLKPRAVEFLEVRKKTKRAGRNRTYMANRESAGGAQAPAREALTTAVVHPVAKNGDLE